MDNPSFTITSASTSDIPLLGTINALAYAQEPIARFAFRVWPNEPALIKLMTLRLTGAFANPNTQVFKAADVLTGEVLGFVTLRLDGVEGAEPVKNNSEVALKAMAGVMNVEFLMKTKPNFRKVEERFKGEKCFYISSFAVHPQHQGKGIGSALLSHILRVVDGVGVPARLDAFPGSHEMYMRFGFEDFESVDVDLSEWSRHKYCGWGIYRTTAMVREVREKVK